MARAGPILSAERIYPFAKAIFNSSEPEPPRLKCPALDPKHYEALRLPSNKNLPDDELNHIEFYFALDLRKCLPILPRLIGSIVEAVQFLGVQRCALSIVEGHSPDGTGDVLRALRPFFEEIGLRYWYQESSLDPTVGERIEKLAALRNLALEPLLRNQDRASEQTTILFVNDVAACAEDLLELAFQQRKLNADMTCAMDWASDDPIPTFYDVWVSRTIAGDSFFDVPPSGSWRLARNLFWNAPDTQARFKANKPFQVFSCWNGATAISAAPILKGLRFRHSEKGECYQGEPQLFCKDMWFRGFHKIAVIPTVNLEYTNEKATAIKKLKGYTSNWTNSEDGEDQDIKWVSEPPEMVRCMPTWTSQFWSAWNETLV